MYCISIIKTKCLILFREIITLNDENYKKQTNIPNRQNSMFLKPKVGSIYNQYVLQGNND